jgi:hypothetical protein
MNPYSFGNYDPFQGGKNSKSFLGVGKTRPFYNTPIPIPDNEFTEDEEVDLDDFVDSLSILSPESGPLQSSDPYSRRSVDNTHGQIGNLSTGIFEFAGHHRNPIRQGISPYKQPRHSGLPIGTGGSSQAFRTTGNYRRTGTQYGTSRPHKLLTDPQDDYIFNVDDILDPLRSLERSFRRQQNRVKKVLSLIKECENSYL